MSRSGRLFLVVSCAVFGAQAASAQRVRQPDWPAAEAEALAHFQALVRMDTSDPPGNERPAAEYLKQVLEREGLPTQVFAVEPHRPNVVARLKGNGAKRPLLIMAHTDVVNVDPKKWTHPPFAAERADGYIYGRGTTDDKDNVTAALMAILLLKRNNVPLDRDVIFLAEAGEEGNTRFGIEPMVNDHYDTIDAEYCIAEVGNVVRANGAVRYATVATGEKLSKGIDLIAHGPSGHGSIPLESNAVTHLSRAIAAITKWQPPVVLNATTRTYFERLASISPPEQARQYRDMAKTASWTMVSRVLGLVRDQLIAGVFGAHGVSIQSMQQKGEGDGAHLIFVTHLARESDMLATVRGVRELDLVKQVGRPLRAIGAAS